LLPTILVAILITSVQARADFPEARDIDLIQRLIDAGFREQYSIADSLSVELQHRYPEHPVGYVLHAAMLQRRMLDKEYFIYEDQFRELLKATESKAENALEDNKKDAWAMYCLGLAHGTRAVFDARAGSWWSALRHGIKAKHAFEECVRTDSTIIDAYVGIGSYHYWRTAKTKAINWLPLVQDDRKEGIEELWMASERSLFSEDFAQSALIWIFMDKRDYVAADSIARKLRLKYPTGSEFLWAIAYARMGMRDNGLSIQAFDELVRRVKSDPENNNYNIVECRMQLARLYLYTGRYDECREQCSIIDTLTIAADVRKRLNHQLSETEKIKRRVEKLK
jgi:tetratricopeptide (TPR) repeat protein